MAKELLMNRINEFRKRHKLSLEKLALACVPPTTAQQIQRLEKGDRRLTDGWMRRVSKGFKNLGLEVTPSDLLPSQDTRKTDEDWNEKISALEAEHREELNNYYNYLLGKDKK